VRSFLYAGIPLRRDYRKTGWRRKRQQARPVWQLARQWWPI